MREQGGCERDGTPIEFALGVSGSRQEELEQKGIVTGNTVAYYMNLAARLPRATTLAQFLNLELISGTI